MRKPQIQPSLASLTESDREQLADWLRHAEYKDVLERVNKPRPDGFGLTLRSEKPLRTFYAKVALFDLINARLPDDKKLTLAEFENLSSTTFNFEPSTCNRVAHDRWPARLLPDRLHRGNSDLSVCRNKAFPITARHFNIPALPDE